MSYEDSFWPDLASSVPSRIVKIDATNLTETFPKNGRIAFTLPCDLHHADSGKILAASTETAVLSDGTTDIRLPVYSTALTSPEYGNEWAIAVRKSWSPITYYIRVPSGSGPISLAAIPVVSVATRHS